MGSTFSIVHVSEYPANPFSYLVGGISSSKSIYWTEEIIDSVIEYWDWEELCSNRSIRWTAQMVNKYQQYINFESLSNNTNVEWSYDLLHQFKQKLNWKELSGNSGLPWSVNLINEFIQNWTWKPEYNSYFNEGWKSKPCLSINEGILWTTSMIYTWKDKVDLWLIARNGNISSDVFYEFREDFRRKEYTKSIYHKWSDWRDTENIFKSAWECFLENKNFVITQNVLPLLKEEEVNLTFAVGSDFAMTGPLLSR